MSNPFDFYKRISFEPLKTEGVLDGGENPVPLLYNNEGQYNPAPRINQPAPVQATQQPQETNPFKRFFTAIKTPEGYIRPEGQGLSANNPFATYYHSKWWKPTITTQMKAQEWESQNQAKQAKTADNFTIDEQFINTLSNNDPIKPYLRPGMVISTDQLRYMAAANQKQSAMDVDRISDDDRNKLFAYYEENIPIYNPDGTINRDNFNQLQAIKGVIGSYTSRKALDAQLGRLALRQAPQALPEVKSENIQAGTAQKQEQTKTEPVRRANIVANTKQTEIENGLLPQKIQSEINRNNRSNQGKGSGSSGSSNGSGWTKDDKYFMQRVDKDYSQYVTQMKSTYKNALVKPKDEWLKNQYPEKFNRYYKLQHGFELPSGRLQMPKTEIDTLVQQHKGTARALINLWGSPNVKQETVKGLLDRYNRVNKTNYSLTEFYNKFVKNKRKG